MKNEDKTPAQKAAYTKKRNAVRSSILRQTDPRKMKENAVFADMVEDYMNLWDSKNKLAEDIEARGVSVEVHTSTGTNYKTNESVTNLAKTLEAMQKLIIWLGLKPDIVADGSDEDEL